MEAVYCRLIFQDFESWFIDHVIESCKKRCFLHISKFSAQQPVVVNSDVWQKSTEMKFSFVPKLSDNTTRIDKYEKLVLGFAELSSTFEEYRCELLQFGLPCYAVVFFNILSRNIYPNIYKFGNEFHLQKFGFGSINEKRYFAPTFLWDEPKGEEEHRIFSSFLHETRDRPDIGSNMVAFFDHEGKTVTACFPDIVSLFDGRVSERVVEIKLKYSSIRRIIVEIACKECGELGVILTFQLNHPPLVLINKVSYAPDRKYNFRSHERYTSWRPSYPFVQSSISHGSCFVAQCHNVDGKSLLDGLDRLRKSIFSIEFRILERKSLVNIAYYQRDWLTSYVDLPERFKKLTNAKYFSLVYAVSALISRGGELYDYFFRHEYKLFGYFLDTVVEYFDRDSLNCLDGGATKTVSTLETMLQIMERLDDIPHPVQFFVTLYNVSKHQLIAEITDELKKDGYMRIRKIIVTPTRNIFLNPELMLGNRSLRMKGADSMLRVIFRDDDGLKISGLPFILVERTVGSFLRKPFLVGFRYFHYLGSSSSQLRDHGCYLMSGTLPQVEDFRQACGRFSEENISKIMSRLGQCFTQARQLTVEIDRSAYSEIFDYTGGCDKNGKPYCFSDGVGLVSLEFCQKIVHDLNLGINRRPSCFQIRFRGYKGIIQLDTHMDNVKKWAIENDRIPQRERGQEVPWYCQSILFRPSQRKFHGPRDSPVEIVKISNPITVALNKPLINILDQVSEMQGSHIHRRVCSRITELFGQHVDRSLSSLTNELDAYATFSSFPKYIFYDRLLDFNVTKEPFLRSLLRASAFVGLHKLVEKLKIQIPASQGRMMFGVIDVSGYLQYGQVFVQYTTHLSTYFPTTNAAKTVHTGPVMITKNPSIVAGDVRMFEAVDIPCLHDLVDVVVFPQHGPRPHSDEMAGSDLDGDEYTVIWDPQLFLDHNEPAFDYASQSRNKPILSMDEIKNNMTKEMIDFFTLYISQDSIGTIANAHLANSDCYGINSEACLNIALKHNQAVDFSKSGVIPEKLTRKWQDGVPPEKIERYPNFMAKNHIASYKSTRLLGELYCRALKVKEILRTEELAVLNEHIYVDESVVMAGDEIFQYEAYEAYAEYSTLIAGICEQYGINHEGQLFSGRFMAFKTRVNYKEADPSAATAGYKIVDEQVATIFANFRSKFFNEFGGLKENTEMDDNRFHGIREEFRRVCVAPSVEMRKKASAYYRVAYNSGKWLSFGWIASDVLAFNRQEYCFKTGKFKVSLCH